MHHTCFRCTTFMWKKKTQTHERMIFIWFSLSNHEIRSLWHFYVSTCSIFDHGVRPWKWILQSATTPTYLTLRDDSCSRLILSLSNWSSIWRTLRRAKKKRGWWSSIWRTLRIAKKEKRMRFETQAHNEEDFEG